MGDRVRSVENSAEKNRTRNFPGIVTLNVGGCHYVTRLSTLCKYPDSMLAAMFSGRHQIDQDTSGNYFIDSNGSCFVYILDYLRHGTIPPNDMALKIYKEACYYNIVPLIRRLRMTPDVAKMLVHEEHRNQFPDYEGTKLKVINTAILKATATRIGEVLIYAFREQFVSTQEFFNADHECLADTADVKIGPWSSPVHEEVFINTLKQDLVDDGFTIKQHDHRKQCDYFSGENCKKAIYKITFIF